MKVPTKLTEAQAAILSLLTSEFPPDPVHPWVRMEVDYDGTVDYSGQVGGQMLSVTPFGDGGWAVRGLDLIGIGRTIPAAIGDFRVKVTAAAVAVGATPDDVIYAAIYAAFLVDAINRGLDVTKMVADIQKGARAAAALHRGAPVPA